MFDFVVVVVSVITWFAGHDAPPGLKELRLLRAFRIFRLFKRIESLRKILRALQESIPGVINAFLILLLVHMLYAILGVQPSAICRPTSLRTHAGLGRVLRASAARCSRSSSSRWATRRPRGRQTAAARGGVLHLVPR